MFENFRRKDGGMKKMKDEFDENGEGKTSLSGDKLDARIAELESELAELYRLLDSENRERHTWKEGRLPGGVKIRSCLGDAFHEGHWEKV